MTILEAIQSNPVFVDISADSINYTLISRSIDGATSYDNSSLKDVELASADIYYDMAVLPNFKEGQLSLEYNSEVLLNRAKTLYNKYGDPKGKEFEPKIINVGISAVE